MTGRQLDQEMHTNFQREEPMHIRALQGHSGENLDVSTLSREKIDRGYASLLHHIGFSRRQDSITFGGRVPGGFGPSKGRKAVYFSLVSPLDPNPDPQYKPYFHMKNHHHRLFVIDLEAAHNSLELHQTANGSTVPSEFLTQIINLQDG